MGLVTGGNSALTVGSGFATQLSNDVPGTVPLPGNARGYLKAPYSAFSDVFSGSFSGNSGMSFNLDMSVVPSTFPAQTTFTWAVTPGSWGGINGYQHVDYGNYDDSASSITPKQTKNITVMSLNYGWTFASGNATGLLCECWLSTSSHTSGPVSSDALFEVGFFPRCSTASQAYAAGATSVGSFVDANSITWNVGQAVTGIGTFPYFVATRVGYVDHHGPLDFKAYFTFLQAQGKITGNEWFNGASFGPELYIGSGVASVDSFATTYS